MTNSSDSLSNGLSWTAIGFGAASAVAPRAFATSYGLEHSPSTHIMLRMWGTRTVVLGALGLMLNADARSRMAPVLAAMNLADVVLIASASNHPARSRIMGAASSAVFAVGFGYLASRTTSSTSLEA